MIVENLPVPFDRRVWCQARALQRAGYDVSVICPKGGEHQASFERLDGIDIYRHPLPEASGFAGYLAEYGTALFWEYVLAFKALFRGGFDAVHLCNPPDLLFLVGGFFRLFGKRVLFDHHDLSPEVFEAKFGRRGPFWRALCVAERLTFATAQVVISTNESYRNVALSRGGKRQEDVFIVRSGPDLSRLRRLPPNPEWKRGRRFLVAYVGVMGEQEGIDLLLEIAGRVRDIHKRDDVQFVLVGGGPSLQRMKDLSRDLGLEDRVTFTGRAPDDVLFEVLATADVCVNPDRPNPFNDMSTMNKIMEYMAFGKPIVQFDLKEGRFSARESSLYASDTADFAEKIVLLLDDPDKREAMGQLGLERVRQDLSWPNEEPKLLAAYDRLFAKGGVRRMSGGSIEPPGHVGQPGHR